MADAFVEGLPLVDVDRVATIRFPVPSGSSRDVWDLARSPGGEVYAAVSPIHEPGTPQLYRFDVAHKAMELVFDLSELTILPRKGIPANKIHTSMAFADDNTLFLVSHTTAAAPGHARWAPLACYHDLYDGFAGSHLLRVDLRRGDARCLGIPVPRESLWGGSCYLPETGEYLAIGLVRGHLYSIRVGDLSVMDLGFVGRGCRLFRDSRGRAYGISPSGRRARAILYRYDPARGAIEPLDVELPRSRGASLAFAQPGPDGRIYLARNFYDPFWNLDEVVDDESTDHLFAFDPDSEALEDLGCVFPGARDLARPPTPRIPRRIVVGPAFLEDDCLYCGVLGGSLDGFVALVRWNISAGTRPEFLGFLHSGGTPVPFVWDSAAGSDGRLYFARASAGVFAARPELIGVDATGITAVGVPMCPAEGRYRDPPGFDPGGCARTERPAAGDDPHLGPRLADRIELYDLLPGAESCAVTSMIRAGARGICVGTRSGAIVMWNGRESRVSGRLDGPVCSLAHDGDRALVATGRTICRLILPEPSDGVRLEEVAALGDGEQCSHLGARGGLVYGLLAPGAVPFVLSGREIRRGPSTGVVPGRRVLWPADPDTLLGAFDGGEIFCWRPGESPQGTGAFIPSPRGRRFLVRWTAACSLDDVVFGATSDGYVFEYDPRSGMVRNLGKPALSLGIRDLTTDGSQVFGIAGRADDVCSVFGYSRRTGFIDYGTDVAGSMELSVLVCLGDGRVAVAEDARLAHVNVYDLRNVEGIRPSDPEERPDGGGPWNCRS